VVLERFRNSPVASTVEVTRSSAVKRGAGEPWGSVKILIFVETVMNVKDPAPKEPLKSHGVSWGNGRRGPVRRVSAVVIWSRSIASVTPGMFSTAIVRRRLGGAGVNVGLANIISRSSAMVGEVSGPTAVFWACPSLETVSPWLSAKRESWSDGSVKRSFDRSGLVEERELGALGVSVEKRAEGSASSVQNQGSVKISFKVTWGSGSGWTLLPVRAQISPTAGSWRHIPQREGGDS